MKRRNDIYNVGNDYDQEVSAYFVTNDDDAALSANVPGYKAYSDGLYHFTKKPAYELSGGADALNKRVINNLPQSQWAVPEFLKDADPSAASAWAPINAGSAVLSPDYATVENPQVFDWANAPITKK